MSEPVALNDFSTLWATIRAEALQAIDEVGRSGWWVLGRQVEQFETALAARFDLSHAVGCGNGLDALEIALRCLGLTPGTPVLTTPLTAFATTLAIVRAGGVPWYVDVDESGLLDLDRVEEVVCERQVRWLLPVHLYGHALDLERLEALKRRYELTIVEDCAQAIGARSAGRWVGTVGQAAATSFYPTKNLGAMGDGGALLTGLAPLAAQARSLRDYGQRGKYEHAQLGLNSRLDELQAALLRQALLPRLDGFTERRVAIAGRYRAEIRNPDLVLPPPPPGSESVWHLFPVLCERGEALMAHLAARQIKSARHYPRLASDQEALQGIAARSFGELSRARRFAADEVSLPIHPFLTEADVDRVVRACNEL